MTMTMTKIKLTCIKCQAEMRRISVVERKREIDKVYICPCGCEILITEKK